MKVAGVLHNNGLAARGTGGRTPARGMRGEIIRLLDWQRGKARTADVGEAPVETGVSAWEYACAARARAGDASAFDRLVDAYTGRIHAHLRRIVRSREDAEDLTQETFIRAYRALARFDTRRPFRNWLYTIATNVGLNALRTKSRRIQATSLDAETDDGKPRREAVSPRPDGRSLVERSERRARLEEAIDQLPPRVATLVRLHYHEEMPLREAGEIVGMGESAAKVALHRARKRMREMLTGDETL